KFRFANDLRAIGKKGQENCVPWFRFSCLEQMYLSRANTRQRPPSLTGSSQGLSTTRLPQMLLDSKGVFHAPVPKLAPFPVFCPPHSGFSPASIQRPEPAAAAAARRTGVPDPSVRDGPA